MRVDHFYQLHHRRLRDTFRMETIERHEAKIMAALDKRREFLRGVRVRKTPRCLHPYTAAKRGNGAYGWGNSPEQAITCLRRQLAPCAEVHT